MSEAKSSRVFCDCSRRAVKNGKCAFCLRCENNRTRTTAKAGRKRTTVSGLTEYAVGMFVYGGGKTPVRGC